MNPILNSTSSSLLADDKSIVVTSNVTQLACIRHTQLSLAATAQHLWGNPTPQYLNAMTIATHMVIADTGAITIFIMEVANVANRRLAQKPLTINLPDGNKVMPTHICNINIPGLPTVLTGHIVPSLTIASLMGIQPLCKVGCTVVFDNDKCDVMFNRKVTLCGYKDPLWMLPITNKVGTTPGLTVMPRPSPCLSHAPHLPIKSNDVHPGVTLATFNTLCKLEPTPSNSPTSLCATPKF